MSIRWSAFSNQILYLGLDSEQRYLRRYRSWVAGSFEFRQSNLHTFFSNSDSCGYFRDRPSNDWYAMDCCITLSLFHSRRKIKQYQSILELHDVRQSHFPTTHWQLIRLCFSFLPARWPTMAFFLLGTTLLCNSLGTPDQRSLPCHSCNSKKLLNPMCYQVTDFVLAIGRFFP